MNGGADAIIARGCDVPQFEQPFVCTTCRALALQEKKKGPLFFIIIIIYVTGWFSL
jgi:hypothetical protein